MLPPLRPLAGALLLATLLALPARAQHERETPDVVAERDSDGVFFRFPDERLRRWMEEDHARVFRSDTVIDGRRVLRLRLPDGDERMVAFEVPDVDPEDFRAFEDEFRQLPPGLFFDDDGEPLGLPGRHLRGLMDGLSALDGVSDATRHEMMELERRAHELAEEARRAGGRARDEAERELDDVLGQLFDARGRMRDEQAAHLEEQADRLRDRANALRQTLRERQQERRALIEERKRELLGEPGARW